MPFIEKKFSVNKQVVIENHLAKFFNCTVLRACIVYDTIQALSNLDNIILANK